MMNAESCWFCQLPAEIINIHDCEMLSQSSLNTVPVLADIVANAENGLGALYEETKHIEPHTVKNQQRRKRLFAECEWLDAVSGAARKLIKAIVADAQGDIERRDLMLKKTRDKQRFAEEKKVVMEMLK